MDTPLSKSSVSLKLEEIQRRRSELRDSPDSMFELSLEESPVEVEHNDPYNRGRS